MFVNTDRCNYKEEINAKKIVNHNEAKIVCNIVTSLLDCGIACKDVGIICPYRHQLEVLKASIRGCASGGDGLRDLEIETIDKYQVEIFSC